MHFTEAGKFTDDLGANVETRAQCRILGQVEKHRREYFVLVFQAYTTDPDGRILALGKLPRSFIARTLERERIYRGPVGTPVVNGVSMHGYKQIGLVESGDGRPLAMVDVIISVPDQYGFHAGLGVDARGQGSRNLQRHVLFAGSSLAHRAGIMPAVAGVDRNYDVTARFVCLGRAFDRTGCWDPL
jgi:hypothetical protein